MCFFCTLLRQVCRQGFSLISRHNRARSLSTLCTVFSFSSDSIGNNYSLNARDLSTFIVNENRKTFGKLWPRESSIHVPSMPVQLKRDIRRFTLQLQLSASFLFYKERNVILQNTQSNVFQKQTIYRKRWKTYDKPIAPIKKSQIFKL